MAETPGWQTTEFWVVIMLFALVIANGPLQLGLSGTDLISIAVGVAGYSGARGLAKLPKSKTVTKVVTTPIAPRGGV